jgi:hypothetical protein
MKPSNRSLYPRVGEIWRTTQRVGVGGATFPAGTLALVVEAGPPSVEFSTVLDMTILIEGQMHSVFSRYHLWEHVNEDR